MQEPLFLLAIMEGLYTIEMKYILNRSRLALGLCITVISFTGLLIFINTDYFDASPVVRDSNLAAVYLDSAQPIEMRVADLLSRMTLAEKIGQMTLVEKDSLKSKGDIAKYHLGAILSGAGAKPVNNTPAGWKEMIDEYQTTARQSRLGIPLLYGADAVHGHAHVPGATVFPHAIGLGAANNPELVRAVARATAEEIFATGVNWSFSPNLDQPRDIRWGRAYEAFSDDSTLVENLGTAYLEGLQNNLDYSSDRVFILATPKHYLGLGSMSWGTSLNENFKIDQGVTPADEIELRAHYLPPFAAAVEAGALSIMVGLNTWGDKRMVLQEGLLTDILKQELGFKGFLVSDWYGVHEGRVDTFFATVQAINAGVDMVMLPFDYEVFARHMKWANRLGLVSDERIDDAVGRILLAKFALGLFDEERVAIPQVVIPSVSNQKLAKAAVAQSLVLLKNQADLLPLSPSLHHIRVAGSAADNAGRQMGAWTIEWQGVDGNWPPGATSILEGIKLAVSSETVVEYDALGKFANQEGKAPVGIAVVGETPYAEGWGDTPYPTLSEQDLTAINNLRASCERVVVVIVSGRPLFITRELEDFDSLVMAWLPGGEGEGLADGLFGRTPFTGVLPLPWPRHSEQLPIQPSGETVDDTLVLFPRYFGLSNR